jgi:carboxylesterase type B
MNASNRTVDASHHGPACINFNIPPPYDQGFGVLLGNQTVSPQSEDCLNLDVYVPDGDHCDLPVLFYTPGGGFLLGASYLYDMRPLVERGSAMGKPFIGVSINYRLGPLGFLNPSDNIFNLGLQDQFAALRWVKQNIGVFGGDPNNLIISKLF